ncbi:hypothetical protein BC829DRAFT_25018 [Chytridium lagenaria]|nr:hypothetical protein BC829DRAFT_25018 [Chytridium lagenaria]
MSASPLRQSLLRLALAFILAAWSIMAAPVTLIVVPPAEIIPGQPVLVTWAVTLTSEPPPIGPSIFQSPGVIEFRLVTAPSGFEGEVLGGYSIDAGIASFTIPITASGRISLVAFQPGPVPVGQVVIVTTIGGASVSSSITSSTTASPLPSPPALSSPPTLPSPSPLSSPAVPVVPNSITDIPTTIITTTTSSSSLNTPTATTPSNDPQSNSFNPPIRANDSYFANGTLNASTISVIIGASVVLILIALAATCLYCARTKNAKRDAEIFEAMAKVTASERERESAARDRSSAGVVAEMARNPTYPRRPSMGK